MHFVINNNNTEGILSLSLNESLTGSGKHFCVNKKKHLNTSFVTVTIDFIIL
jgi:hypothetical protein